MSTDLIGTRFGCRVVISATQQGKRLRGDARRRPRVACQCDCGAIDVVEVRKGLQAGEMIVRGGQEKLVEGQSVQAEGEAK